MTTLLALTYRPIHTYDNTAVQCNINTDVQQSAGSTADGLIIINSSEVFLPLPLTELQNPSTITTLKCAIMHSAPSATALLQHGIQFLLPLKIVPPYTVSSVTSSLTS